MPARRSERFLSRSTLVIVAVIVALVAGAVVVERSNLGGLRLRTKPSSSTTATVPPLTAEEQAAAERFANAGKAPIAAADRGVVDLAGTRDFTAPGLGVPTARCTGTQAGVRVTATDDDRIAAVDGTYTRSDGSRLALAFGKTDDAWTAVVETEPGTADAVSIVARDTSGNTLSRTLTNLCG